MAKDETAFDRIPVRPETKHRLKIYAVVNRMKYDEAINHLLDKADKTEKQKTKD